MRNVFKEEGNSNRKWDGELYVWAAPRILIYAGLKYGGERSTWMEVFLQELFIRFPDIDPNHIGFLNDVYASRYVAGIRLWVGSRTAQISTALAKTVNPEPMSVEESNRYIDVQLKSMFEKPARVRPHDLYANDDERREQMKGAFDIVFAAMVKEIGEREAWRRRLPALEEFRKARFEADAPELQTKYANLANGLGGEEKLDLMKPDQATFVLRWLPALKMIHKWFSETAGVPVFFATGSESLENPGFVDVYS